MKTIKDVFGYPFFLFQICNMKEWFKKILTKKNLRNKYVITIVVFFVYILFLDDLDIFMLFRQKSKLSHLQEQTVAMEKQLKDTKNTLHKLSNLNNLEAYARSEKFFKKSDEDIFVILEK